MDDASLGQHLLPVLLIAALILDVLYCLYLIRAGRFHLSHHHESRRRPSSSASYLSPYPPASRNSPLHSLLLERFPTSTYSSTAQHTGDPSPECAICLNEFNEGDTLRVLPQCDHFFHLDCIDNWFRTNKTCPLCRKVVTLPSAGEGGQLENSSNVNLPPPIWCPRNRDQVVVIDIVEEDQVRS